MPDRYSSPQRTHLLPARSQSEPHFESPGRSLLGSGAVGASDLAVFSAPVARPTQKTDCSTASPATGPKVSHSPLDSPRVSTVGLLLPLDLGWLQLSS